MPLTLEQVLTGKNAFALVTASPLQRAICRIADGLPLGILARNHDVIAAVGDVSALPAVPPAELGLLAAIRTAKSMFAAALAVRASQTCDVTGLGPGETPRVSVLSLSTDLARVVYDHILGAVRSKPALSALLIGEPTADSIMLRHPSGRAIEIKITAGSRAGASLVARWSAGVVFDEAPRMQGEADGVVNFDDARRAVLGRLLSGAQLIWIGSPHAPFGPVFDAVQEHWGKPTRDLVIIKATGPMMNPAYWTAERCERLRVQDATAYRTDVLAEFADPAEALMTAEGLDAVTRAAPLQLPYSPDARYIAAFDPGSRRNAFALAIVAYERRADRTIMVRTAFTTQWVPRRGQPISPEAVFQVARQILGHYHITQAWSDQYAIDAHIDLAARAGFELRLLNVDPTNKHAMYTGLAMLVATRQIELSPDPVLRSDLLGITKRITQRSTTIDLRETSDGRHSDLAAALAMAAWQASRLASRPAPAKQLEISHVHSRAQENGAISDLGVISDQALDGNAGVFLD